MFSMSVILLFISTYCLSEALIKYTINCFWTTDTIYN